MSLPANPNVTRGAAQHDPKSESLILAAICEQFHRLFEQRYQVRVAGGFDEPFYRAPRANRCGEIQYRHDYLNSCLHEMAHWFIAGEARRQQDDFGYWYAPDGRDAEQQALFFRNEVKPQAMEWALADACGAHFRLSVDNLSGEGPRSHDLEVFAKAVANQKALWEQSGFPLRAQEFLIALASKKTKENGLEIR